MPFPSRPFPRRNLHRRSIGKVAPSEAAARGPGHGAAGPSALCRVVEVQRRSHVQILKGGHCQGAPSSFFRPLDSRLSNRRGRSEPLRRGEAAALPRKGSPRQAQSLSTRRSDVFSRQKDVRRRPERHPQRTRGRDHSRDCAPVGNVNGLRHRRCPRKRTRRRGRQPAPTRQPSGRRLPRAPLAGLEPRGFISFYGHWVLGFLGNPRWRGSVALRRARALRGGRR
mmetsp:Transcript_27886/g.96379  ORF Transcript_27886/g.96379 Transcript_27886/m.96379 type:complete len:225 (+) Transcript_27886:763-1437(+)